MIYPFWEDWLLYHNVIFDGVTKTIWIAPSVSIVSVKEDLYSSWKEWVSIRDNAKFEQAMRTIGGDPVGGGLYAGDMYFLMNGWQIHVDHNIKVNGILYHDDGIDPFLILPAGGVTATVSSLAYAYNTTGVTVPTAGEISSEVWNAASTAFNTAGTTGAQLNKAVLQTATVAADIQNANMKLDSLPIGVSAQIVVDLQDEITAINTIPALHAEVAAVPGAVRTNLSTELTHIMTLQNGQGLNSTQATMLLEIYRLYGLDPTMPLVVSNTSRVAGPISQTIDISTNTTTVTRE